MQKIFLYIVLTVSILDFILCFADKRFAVKHKWRIPEATLLLLAFLGGAAELLLGMLLFHHKTKKAKFLILTPLFLILHVIVYFLL